LLPAVSSLSRIEALKELAFEKKGFDGFLVANEMNLLYLTRVPDAAYLFIPKKGEGTVYVYSVNYEMVKAEAKGLKVELMKRGQNLAEKMAPQIKAAKIKKLATDGISYDTYRMLAKGLRGKANVKVQSGMVSELRKVKEEKELELMRKAGELTSLGMKVAYETVRQGLTEIEVAAEIEYSMRKRGGWGTAFETIVASGVHSAYPHGGCENRKIHGGDVVVVDMGAMYEYYRSDITRTIVAGKPTEKQKKLYDVVKEAHEKAYYAIKPKARGKDVDLAARKVIEKAGYGDLFNHGLGHGVGLEVHEAPVLGPSSKDRLAVGNVVTDEPGIYLVGYAGFRIEDTVLVQKGQGEKFTKAPYTLEAEA
jgi:Xaa-Pro aminopeptidase